MPFVGCGIVSAGCSFVRHLYAVVVKQRKHGYARTAWKDVARRVRFFQHRYGFRRFVVNVVFSFFAIGKGDHRIVSVFRGDAEYVFKIHRRNQVVIVFQIFQRAGFCSAEHYDFAVFDFVIFAFAAVSDRSHRGFAFRRHVKKIGDFHALEHAREIACRYVAERSGFMQYPLRFVAEKPRFEIFPRFVRIIFSVAFVFRKIRRGRVVFGFRRGRKERDNARRRIDGI